MAPVVVGIALAYRDGVFTPLPALAALACALLLQVGVNVANDYYDHVKGVDAADRLGPTRVTQSGLIPPEQVRLGMILVFAAAALVGVYLVLVGGWPILIVGAASIVSALAYTGGPYPLSSHGLGDLFVFIFFGLVAVAGTYYVQALTLTRLVLIAAIPMGTLAAAILVVNNLRDIDTDRRAGKNTLAVIVGGQITRVEYVVLLAVAYLVPAWLWLAESASMWVILPWGSLPLAFQVGKTIASGAKGRVLNAALAQTARLELVFAFLFGIGLVI